MKLSACLVIYLCLLCYSSITSREYHANRGKEHNFILRRLLSDPGAFNAYGQSNSNNGKEPKDILCKLLKKSGVFIFNVYKFGVQVDKSWARYAKFLIEEQKTESLKDMKPKEVDEIFRKTKNLGNITIFRIEALATGPDLFKEDEWKIQKNEKEKEVDIESGETYTMESSKPILTYQKDGIKFEFKLGPRFSQADKIDLKYFDENNNTQGGKFSLSDPTLDIILKDNDHTIRYSIFVHKSEVNGVKTFPNTQNQKYENVKVFNIVRGITETLLKNIDKNQPLKDAPGFYSYYSKKMAVAFDDDSSEQIIQQWINPISDTHVEVDLYKAIKKYLGNAEVLTMYDKYSNIPHNQHKLDADGFENRILYGDKFAGSNKFVGPKMEANFKPVDKPNRFILDVVKSRAGEILNRAEKESISLKELPKWQNWIEGMVKKDFEKHRELSGIKGKFKKEDKHFSGHGKEKFDVYFRKLGPPYGVSQPTDEEYESEEECETEETYPDEEYETEEECETEETFPDEEYETEEECETEETFPDEEYETEEECETEETFPDEEYETEECETEETFPDEDYETGEPCYDEDCEDIDFMRIYL